MRCEKVHKSGMLFVAAAQNRSSIVDEMTKVQPAHHSLLLEENIHILHCSVGRREHDVKIYKEQK